MVLKVPFNLNSRVRKFEVRLGPPGGDKGYKVSLEIMIIVLVVITMWWQGLQYGSDDDVDYYDDDNKTHNLTIMLMMMMMTMMAKMALAQNPISTLSHIWVFVRQYGIRFVIIVIIIIYRKVKVSTLKHVWLHIDWSWGMGWWCKQF